MDIVNLKEMYHRMNTNFRNLNYGNVNNSHAYDWKHVMEICKTFNPNPNPFLDSQFFGISKSIRSMKLTLNVILFEGQIILIFKDIYYI